jgi:hypothetical protein
MGVDEARLADFSRSRVYPDGTVIRVFVQRTDSEAFPSGWRYTFHYGALDPDTLGSLSDGTIRRYDNAHEDTKGHERHVAQDPEPAIIEFPGIVELWEQFWAEVPKTTFEPDTEA